MGRFLAALLLVSAVMPSIAAAQTRTVTVPAGSAVVIAPRGQPAPRVMLGAPTRGQARAIARAQPSDDLTAPSAAAAIALAGAAGLAVALAGGGGGGGGASAAPGATVRTR